MSEPSQVIESPATVPTEAAEVEAAVETVAPAADTKKPAKPRKPPKSKKGPAAELARLGETLAPLSVKNTGQLSELREGFNRLRKSIKGAKGKDGSKDSKDADSSLQDSLSAFYDKLSSKLSDNQKYQKKVQEATAALFETLQKALDEGRSHDALPAWDRIQGNIGNTSGKIHSALLKRAEEFRGPVSELRDWKAFAATQKKKELLEQMKQLAGVKMAPADLNRRINEMHREWKDIRGGNRREDDKLWKQFKKLSDAAAECCKPYLAERKKLMAANLAKREALCTKMEAALKEMTGSGEASAPPPDKAAAEPDKAEPDKAAAEPAPAEPAKVDPGKIQKLIAASEKEWKKHAPVSPAAIKDIRNRFYDSINRLRRLRSDSLKGNTQRKKELVAKAETLAAADDNDKAMDEAKKLQREWKEIGGGNRREDQKLWRAFRTACDKIFAELDAARNEKKEELKRHGEDLSAALEALEALDGLQDEALREKRGEYRDLVGRVKDISGPELRRRHKKESARVAALQRRLEQRFRALPDRRKVLLKQTVEAVAGLLQPAETALLKCKDGDAVAACLEKHKPQLEEARTKLQAPEFEKDGGCQEVLQQRLQHISEAAAPADFASLGEEAVAAIRQLCVELEIRTGADTPDKDQPLRMQLQLERLQEGLGQQDPRDDGEAAFDAELEALCTGPLSPARRKAFGKRLDGLVKRLR